MKLTTLTITLAGLLFAAGASQAQDKQADPLAKHLLPPALILSQAEGIGLSSEQKEKVRSVVETAHEEIAEPQQAMRPAYEALAAELAKTPVDAGAALEKLDQILDLERRMKRLHLTMLVGVNNQLKPEQRAKLSSMEHGKTNESPEVTEKRLKGKIQQLKEIAEDLAAEGQSPAHIHEMMKSFGGLMENGTVDQAEELLDRTLKKLRGKDEAGDADKGAAIDPDALKKELEAMRVKEVAWRKIAWKTCLLDGIQASREQNKPMVLWVFIDRPIDDKRC